MSSEHEAGPAPSIGIRAGTHLWALGLLAALLAIVYWPSLSAPLIFDDALLASPEFWVDYGSITNLKVRTLSYGSFVWIQQIFGERWEVQRLFNVLIHALNCGLLFFFYRSFVPYFVRPSPEPNGKTHRQWALWVAILWFAINPMAVYAVAYLTQRSILMATTCTLLLLISVLRALETGRWQYWVASLVAYLAALLSKEYAIMTPLIAVAIYVAVKRPSPGALFRGLAATGVVVALGGYALYKRYGGLVGTAFDDASITFASQLATLSADVQKNLWPLSILNEMRLFFEYGWRWFFPSTRSMSIDMRPPFPLSLTDWPYVIAALGFVALALAAVFLLLKFRGRLSLLGFCLLIPLTLYATEFATVWIQDPFVLYRSYLWAIAVPGILFLVISLLSARWLALAATVMCVSLVDGAVDRVTTMASPLAVWDDAAKKLPLTLTVGQSRPFRARADSWRSKGEMNRALRDFQRSSRLGDNGEGLINSGTILYSVGKVTEANAAFEAARTRGVKSPELFYNLGMTQVALQLHEEAYASFTSALAGSIDAKLEAEILANRALLSLRLGRAKEALADAELSVIKDKANGLTLTALGFARLANADLLLAISAFDTAITLNATAQNFFGRARARYERNDRVGALTDVDAAIALDAGNSELRVLRARLAP